MIGPHSLDRIIEVEREAALLNRVIGVVMGNSEPPQDTTLMESTIICSFSTNTPIWELDREILSKPNSRHASITGSGQVVVRVILYVGASEASEGSTIEGSSGNV